MAISWFEVQFVSGYKRAIPAEDARQAVYNVLQERMKPIYLKYHDELPRTGSVIRYFNSPMCLWSPKIDDAISNVIVMHEGWSDCGMTVYPGVSVAAETTPR